MIRALVVASVLLVAAALAASGDATPETVPPNAEDLRHDAGEANAGEADAGANAAETLFTRGILLRQAGDFEGAREAWEECLAWARDHRDVEKIELCLHQLALLDASQGNLARAADRWGEAHALLRGEGQLRAAFGPARHAALALRDLDRFEDATAILEQQLDMARQHGYADYEAQALVDLGGIARRRGRSREALRRYEEAQNHLDETSRTESRVEAILGQAAALNADGRTVDALELLELQAGAIRAKADASQRVEIDSELGKQYLLANRPADALSALRRSLSVADSAGLSRYRLRNLSYVARGLRQLGEPDSAIARLREAIGAWEADRQLPLDPEWRDERAQDAPRAFLDLAVLLLERPLEVPENQRTAFDLLQRYKARTLTERVLGPGAPGDSAAFVATLETLQSGTLAPGELLLDVFVGPEASLVFAVTSGECRVARAVGEGTGLRRLVERYLVGVQPVAARATSAPDAEAAADSLASFLFGGCTDLVASAKALLFAPDASLNLISLADLPFQGKPLVERCDLVRVPSASLFARERATRDTTPVPARMLAIAGCAPNGSDLPGADLEVKRLARRFEGVTARAGIDSIATFPALAAGAAILHVAAHAQTDDQHPWRSALRLAPTANESGVIRAAQIASLRLPVRLVFLSGSETAGGRAPSGEGVVGLASAFLAAGVPTVVATTRQVDDRATGKLVESFYDALSRGATAAAALRHAQDKVRRDPATSHASYWSSFVVVGDGARHVELKRRLMLPGAAAFLGLAAIALLGCVIAGRRSARAWVARALLAAAVVCVAAAGWQFLHRVRVPESGGALQAAPSENRWDMIVWDATDTAWPLQWQPVAGAASYGVRVQTAKGDVVAEVPASATGVEMKFEVVPEARRAEALYVVGIAVGMDGPMISTRPRFLPRPR